MDDKGGFDEDLRRALRELNQNAGECPSADVLEAYTRGGLPTSGAAAIQNHLHGCGICELSSSVCRRWKLRIGRRRRKS